MTDNVQAHLYGVEYIRPEQMKFSKERLKATEAEIREAWGVVLDGVKARYERLESQQKSIVRKVRMLKIYDKVHLIKCWKRNEEIEAVRKIRRQLECVVTFAADEGKTLLPPHPTPPQSSPHPPAPSPQAERGSENSVRENVPLHQALEIAKAAAKHLSPYCERIAIAGSVRRKKGTVNDIELVVIPRGKELWDFLDGRLLAGKIAKAEYGKKNGKVMYRWGEKYRGFVWAGMKLEVFAADADNWGYQYLLRTGPWDANTVIMTAVQKRKAPFSFKDGRVWSADGKEIPVPEEKDVFKLLGMEYVAAEKRSPHVYWKEFNRVGHEWGVQIKERP